MALTDFRRLAGLVLLLLLTGCAGYRDIQQHSYLLARSGQLDRALCALEESSLAKRPRDRLLYLMEKGLLLHQQGDYRRSSEVLEEADRLAEELFTRSLSAETLSFATNDTVLPYAGEDYESVYLNYYKALNYLALGELEEAAVEARRVDEKLNWFTDRYGGKNAFQEDAFLRLLTGLIYEALGDDNNAFIAYRLSLKAYEAYAAKYGVAVPKLIWSRLVVSARGSGLWQEAEEYEQRAREAGVAVIASEKLVAVIVNNGSIPVKRQVTALFPTRYGFPVALALPEFVDRSLGVPTVAAALEDGPLQAAEPVANLAAIARRSLEDRKGRVLVKAIARAATKQLAARRAQKEGGPLAGLAAQVFALATERADLRSWTLLPREVRMALLAANAGRYDLILQLGGRRQELPVNLDEKNVAFVFTRIF